MAKIKTAILGASGYTGAELVRLLLLHPSFNITALSAERRAGEEIATVFPQFLPFDLPTLVKIEEIDFKSVDLVFCALPHGTTQSVLKNLPQNTRVVDLSADFRLRDPQVYKKWYNADHQACDLQKEVVYGLPEFYRNDLKLARIVANTGCFVVSALLPILPLLKKKCINAESIIIDSKSGASGAGRAAKEGMLFSEVSEGFHAYGVGKHRHMAELDQEFNRFASQNVVYSFTPHLLPQNRGILSTIYVRGDSEVIYETLASKYQSEKFVHVLPFGQVPHTRHVRGSNYAYIGVVKDRQPNHTIIVSVIDNLVRGASGQAIQNANIMFSLPESCGLEHIAPLFP